MVEQSLSFRSLQVGLLFVLSAAVIVDVTLPVGNLWSGSNGSIELERSDASLRHQAVLHNAHARLNQVFEDGVESPRAADLAIQNLDCWETELTTKGETAKADACKQGFESALAVLTATEFPMQARVRMVEP